MQKKGFYFRQNERDGSLMLNVNVGDFKAFLDTLPNKDGWVKLRIFEREKKDEKGFTHNMEVIHQH
jgi:hypothetical protein